MHHLPADILQAVEHIVSETQHQLSSLLGMPIKLQIQMQPPVIDLNYLQSCVCYVFGISWSQIVSQSRQEKIAIARHAYCYLADTYLQLKDKQIGSHIGRERTTVMNSKTVVQNLLSTHHQIMTANIGKIKNMLSNLEQV